jgi:hypothetical protein
VGVELVFFTLRKQHRLGVLKDVELRKILRSKGKPIKRMRENCIVKSFVIFASQKIILGRRNPERYDGLNTWNL